MSSPDIHVDNEIKVAEMNETKGYVLKCEAAQGIIPDQYSCCVKCNEALELVKYSYDDNLSCTKCS